MLTNIGAIALIRHIYYKHLITWITSCERKSSATIKIHRRKTESTTNVSFALLIG